MYLMSFGVCVGGKISKSVFLLSVDNILKGLHMLRKTLNVRNKD